VLAVVAICTPDAGRIQIPNFVVRISVIKRSHVIHKNIMIELFSFQTLSDVNTLPVLNDMQPIKIDVRSDTAS
jgi:nitrate reductase gamma subunit